MKKTYQQPEFDFLKISSQNDYLNDFLVDTVEGAPDDWLDPDKPGISDEY